MENAHTGEGRAFTDLAGLFEFLWAATEQGPAGPGQLLAPAAQGLRPDAPADALHVSCEDLAKWALVSLQRGKIGGTRDPDARELRQCGRKWQAP